MLNAEFWARKPLVGMVHLPALPGSVGYAGQTMAAIQEQALNDALALEQGGADAIMLENFFDVPFAKDVVPAHTVAAMTMCVQAVCEAVALPLGVNCLRNDARAALAIAHVCGAQFIRVNVFVGAAVTDQGLIEGAARSVMLYRKELGADVDVWADVFVKHAAHLGEWTLEAMAQDARERGRADALIVSGTATGSATNVEEVRRVKAVVGSCPVLIGSGFDVASAPALLAHADGAIVGTSLKYDRQVASRVDPARVRALRDAMNGTL